MVDPTVVDARAVAAEPAASAALPPSRLSAAVSDAIGSEFARHAARFIGADEWRTRSAVDLLVSAVLRRLARWSAGPDGAAGVFAELDNPRIDSDFLATVGRLLADEGGDQGEGLDAGREAAHGLFGPRTEALVFDVASISGLTVDATWQLLALTVPVIYAALRDHVRDRGLDAQALQDQLENERVTAGSKRHHRPRGAVASPAGPAGLFVRDARAGVADAVARRGLYARLVGGIVAVGVVVAVSLWLGGSNPMTGVSSAGSGGGTRLLEDPAGPVPAARRSAALDGLVAFLSSSESEAEYVVALDGVQFEPASATLRWASNAQLAELARVLAAFPDAHATIEAYADGAPDAAGRALAVRAAIAALGVQPSRMRHVGINGASRAGPLVDARVTKGPWASRDGGTP
jgi:outer membrane protein OmpA-like peptidoglycan-associated protein